MARFDPPFSHGSTGPMTTAQKLDAAARGRRGRPARDRYAPLEGGRVPGGGGDPVRHSGCS